MVIHDMPRQSGKTTTILNEVEVCSLFEITPVCIIVCNSHIKFQILLEIKRRVTKNEMKNITVFSKHDFNLLVSLKTINPQRIYIDDFQTISERFLKELEDNFSEKIYAYGTTKE